jgi:transposase
VAAYVGLCPQERSSGSSIRGHGHIGPLGPASLRKALYLPAIVAMRVNPALRTFAERPRAKGKRPKVVITAVMRKLLLLTWILPAHRSALLGHSPYPTCRCLTAKTVAQQVRRRRSALTTNECV